MRCRSFLRWAAICAAVVIAAAPVAAATQEGHEHGQGEMAEGEEHAGHGEMSAEEQAMMAAWQAAGTPGPEHAKLAATAGTFKVTAKSWHQPGGEPEVSEGTAVRTMTLAGRVLEERFTGSMMGAPFEGLGRTGYDNVTDTYWSTWTDNMMTALILFKGTMGDDGSSSFEGDMPDPMSGGMTHMRIETHKEGDKEVHEFFMPGPDGSEMKGMELVYEPAG